MIKRHAAFTLIELMVVVAIIAILATMGVSNFATAIRKARNSVRMNDMMAVSKALETCYNIMDASYGYLEPSASDVDGGTGPKSIGPSSNGAPSDEYPGGNPFKLRTSAATEKDNACLNANIVPTVAKYQYGAHFSIESSVEKYVVCADLEYVDGWESLGNWIGFVTNGDTPQYETFVADAEANKCTTNEADGCMFCVAAQQ